MYLTKFKDLGEKQGHHYFKTENGIIWCDPIDQSNMIGGGHEEGRNTLENPVRLERIRALTNGITAPLVLDFGCGNGMLVAYLKENGINAIGYDKFNEPFSQMATENSVNLITSIECIEHLTDPFIEFDMMFRALISGGKVMFETSFSDWLGMDAPYINPEAGHNTIWSHAGLTAVMLDKGFKEGEHINRNVRIYIKP